LVLSVEDFGQRAHLGTSRSAGAPIVGRTDWRFQSKKIEAFRFLNAEKLSTILVMRPFARFSLGTATD